MRKTLATVAALFLGYAALCAQDFFPGDSIMFVPDNVNVHCSEAVLDSLQKHIEANAARPVVGYRVRIFFSNAQNAREASIEAAELFSSNFPDVPVYRSYVNPNFKVTVGDFHSKSDALRLLSMMRRDFPAAFVVKENLN